MIEILNESIPYHRKRGPSERKKISRIEFKGELEGTGAGD